MFRLYSWDLVSFPFVLYTYCNHECKIYITKIFNFTWNQSWLLCIRSLTSLVSSYNHVQYPILGSPSSSISNVSSPYILHSTDHLDVILVSILFNGDNYPTWKWAMKIALNAKKKLSFVNGALSNQRPPQ
jgi:hypothetical protein